MSISLNDNLKISAPKAIDDRIIKATTIDRDAIPSNERYSGLEVLVTSNFVKYLWNGTSWVVSGSSTSGNAGGDLFGTYPNPSVTWINGYSTYDARYVQFSGTYTNPSWISSLNWNKLINIPTTLVGIGITDAVNINQLGAANGVAQLGPNGTILFSQLPTSLFIYKGGWDASTNTPTLSDGTAVTGWAYKVSTGGTIDLGSGSITFNAGEYVIYNESGVWEKFNNTDLVVSVNGKQGVISLTTDDIPEGTNLYFTNARILSFLTGAVSTVLTSNLSTNKVLISSNTGKIAVSPVSSTELGYLSGVTSDIQTQLNSKQNILTLGDVTGSDFAFTGQTGAIIGSGMTIALATQGGLTPGSYGDSSNMPVFTVNSKGIITNISTVSISSGGGTVYSLSSPATRTVGGVTTGDSLTGLTSNEILEKVLAPYTAPTLGISCSPSSTNYNEQNVTINISATWHKNNGTGSFTSAQIQYQRGSTSGSWTTLTTSVSGTSTDKTATASITINTSGVNNSPIYFNCIFVDTQTNTTNATGCSFASYSSPTASLTNSPSPSLTSGGYMIRSLSTSFSDSIAGSITRNSVNVPLSYYKLQFDYNDNSWNDLSSFISISSSGGSISPSISNTNQPNGKSAIRYRAIVKDSENPSGIAVNNIKQFSIVQPVFFGMSSASSIAAVDLSTLTVVSHGSSNGQLIYSNTTNDKVINHLSFSASNNRFCVAFDNTYGVLNNFFDTGSNLNLITNFTSGTQTVTFADGTSKTYKIYLYNLVVSSGVYDVNIS